MGIKSVKINSIGQSDVRPSIIYIDSDDTVAEVTASGYLTKIASQFSLSEDAMALVSTKTSPAATSTQVAWMELSKSAAGAWSLVPSETTLPLDSAKIFVGNASGVAAEVSMSGDATISNTGVLTLGADVVENAQIADNAVSLENLDSGITPSHIVVYAGKENDGGGSATIAITVTGVAATDIVFAQVQASTNAVTVQKVTPTTDTITVLLSGGS
jgi:hypothetical protein